MTRRAASTDGADTPTVSAEVVPLKPDTADNQQQGLVVTEPRSMIPLSPHVPAAVSLETTLTNSLFAVRDEISRMEAHMMGTQAETKKKVEEIAAKARREITELEDAQAKEDASSSSRISDLRLAEDMLVKGIAPAVEARKAKDPNMTFDVAGDET